MKRIDYIGKRFGRLLVASRADVIMHGRSMAILKSCHYCGIKNGTTTTNKYGSSLEHNGIDRFINEIGYTDKNIVSCCKTCNLAKHAMSPQDFEEWIMRVYSHLFEGNQ